MKDWKMKKLMLLLTLLILTVNLYGQDFYDIETINSIDLYFNEANWDQILDNLYAAGNDERLIGTVVINGLQFDSVGVRYKGNSTYSANQTKNPFNIKLDHIIEDQTIDGYGTLKLANVYFDPSFVRETLGYEIAAKYTPVGRANYANLYVNDVLIGLYTNCQSVDKYFLGSHYNSNDNTFIKGDSENFWGGADLRYLGPDSTEYYELYEMKSDYGWGDLINLCDTLNNYTGQIETILNVDRVLWMMAFHNLLVSLDSPIAAPRNFYLYLDDTRHFNHIIWDLNMTFGTYTMGLGFWVTIEDLQELDPFHNAANPEFPIVNKLLQVPEYKRIYIAHMKTIMAENFSNGWYENRAYQLQALIDADVQADQNKFYSYNDFLINVNTTITQGWQFTAGITPLMEPRMSCLNNHPAFQAIAPSISNVVTFPVSVQPNSEVWFNCAAEDANLVELRYRQNYEITFNSTPMYDDGNHNDGAAGDGVYGAAVDIAASGLDYYIFADNNNAAKFSPVRAEYEFYDLELSGSISELVINEFMADNETVIADPQGEYEDWIELYNGGAETADLAEMFLTDDLSQPDKWAFPDTALAAGGYLLIWADDDEGDPGLHTNFKLSADGEEIGMFKQEGAELALVDWISFEPQAEDTSFGRLPDGSATWQQFPEPTPGWENSYFSPYLITLTPAGSPIQIPAAGGSFDYNIEVVNNDVIAHQVSIWCSVLLPNGSIYGPVLGPVGLQMAAGFIADRDRTQVIPAGAPMGNYACLAFMEVEGDTVSDSFPFEKLDADGGGRLAGQWANYGEDFNDYLSVIAPELPQAYTLFSAYPNPFNPQTNFNYDISEAGNVNLTVYDVQGRAVAEIIDGWHSPGSYTLKFDGRNLASGIYFARLQGEGFSKTQKLMLIK